MDAIIAIEKILIIILIVIHTTVLVLLKILKMKFIIKIIN